MNEEFVFYYNFYFICHKKHLTFVLSYSFMKIVTVSHIQTKLILEECIQITHINVMYSPKKKKKTKKNWKAKQKKQQDFFSSMISNSKYLSWWWFWWWKYPMTKLHVIKIILWNFYCQLSIILHCRLYLYVAFLIYVM